METVLVLREKQSELVRRMVASPLKENEPLHMAPTVLCECESDSAPLVTLQRRYINVLNHPPQTVFCPSTASTLSKPLHLRTIQPKPPSTQTTFKMVSFTAAALSSIVTAGLVQYAPAPWVAVPVVISVNMGSAAAWAGAAGGIIGGAAGVAGAIQSSKKRSVGGKAESWTKLKRQDDAQYGTQLAWELCRDDIQSAQIGMERPQGNGELSLLP